LTQSEATALASRRKESKNKQVNNNMFSLTFRHRFS
jgi:hypothetical protein